MKSKIMSIVAALTLIASAMWPDFPASVVGDLAGNIVQAVLGIGLLVAWWKGRKNGN